MPADERILGADDDEVDVFARASASTASASPAARPGSSCASRAMPSLPGAASTRVDARAPRDLPGERVLASAAAEDQDPHRVSS